MADGQVTVYDCATGATLLRWPVDAREMVATGQYAYDAPVLDVPDVPAVAAEVADDAPAPVARRKRR